MAISIQEKFLHAENRFGDEAQRQGVSQNTIDALIKILSTGKGSHPFMIEAGHHTVRLTQDTIESIDFDENPIANNPGIQNSLRLGLLAHGLRVAKGRTAKIIISLSNLHHTQGSVTDRKRVEELSQDPERVREILDQFCLTLGEDLAIPSQDTTLITQSEATRKARNRIRALLEQYNGTREKAKKVFDEYGYILLHGELSDGIESITMATKSSILSSDSRVAGGVPLLTRMDTDAEWETQCGPTVTGIQHLILERVGKNISEGRILTIDDFTDHQIGVKSARGIHLLDVFTGKPMSNKAYILSHFQGTPIFLDSISSQLTGSSFDDELEKQSNALVAQGYQTVYLYKERVPIKRGGGIPVGGSCDLGLCNIPKSNV